MFIPTGVTIKASLYVCRDFFTIQGVSTKCTNSATNYFEILTSKGKSDLGMKRG